MKKLTKKSWSATVKRIQKINEKATETLSEKQLDLLAKYAYDVLTTGRVGSFRWLIYDVLRPPVGYGDGMYLGLLDFNNQLVDLAGRVCEKKKKAKRS